MRGQREISKATPARHRPCEPASQPSSGPELSTIWKPSSTLPESARKPWSIRLVQSCVALRPRRILVGGRMHSAPQHQRRRLLAHLATDHCQCRSAQKGNKLSLPHRLLGKTVSLDPRAACAHSLENSSPVRARGVRRHRLGARRVRRAAGTHRGGRPQVSRSRNRPRQDGLAR